MTEFFTNFCFDFLSCGEMFLLFLGVFFIGAPKVAFMNMVHPRYQIIGGVFFVTWLAYFFVAKYRPTYIFLLRGRVFGTVLFWVGIAIFYKIGFPLSVRDLYSCNFCGSDYPPLTSLPLTVINVLIFQVVGHALAYMLKLNKKNRMLIVLTCILVFIILQGFALLGILFD